METLTLEVQKRDVLGKKVKQLRNEGILPAVVYGAGSEARSISLNARNSEKVYKELGDSTLIDLKLGGDDSVHALVHDVQRDPMYDRIIHVDFRQVDMKETIELDVELTFVGESPAVKAFGGILVHNMETVSVSCLPSNLVSHIEVDLSGLANLHDALRVKDLPAFEGVTYTSDPEDAVVVVNEPISEEELAALDSDVVVNVDTVQVENDKKEESAE